MYTLNNGLRVLVRPVKGSTSAVINLMYLVGSRNEDPNKTGMAHLLEHIAFGGSRHIDNYDRVLEQAGGRNNAYTSDDVTNYWCHLPANQLEVGLYLESDRLLGLSYKEEVVEVQRNVVIEEFKQTCLNKPYGDIWHILGQEAYKVHPYSWPTIGKSIEQIMHITREDIKAFGHRFYIPSNAVLTIVGGVEVDSVLAMVAKWFEDIPSKPDVGHELPSETRIVSSHRHVRGNVPQNALYKAYHIPGRGHEDYAVLKLLINYFDGDKTSLFYKELVEKQALASSVDVYTTETMDPGLLVIDVKLHDDVSFERVDNALQELIQATIKQGLSERALQKAKNQVQADDAFSQISLPQRAEELAYAVMMGDEDFFKTERQAMLLQTGDDVQRVAGDTLVAANGHTVFYERERSST